MEANVNVAEAQGVEAKKESKKSITYALKAIGDHKRTLVEAKLIDDKDLKAWEEILEKVGAKYVKELWK